MVRLDDIASDVYEFTLGRAPYFAARAGRRVDSIPVGSLAEAEDEASFARATLARLDGFDAGAMSARDRDTLGHLRVTLGEQADADHRWWWTFPVAPYQLVELTELGTHVFDAFAFDTDGDVARYLSLVGDVRDRLRTILAKLQAQRDRGWVLPAPALDGFLAAVRGHRAGLPPHLLVGEQRLQRLADHDRRRLVDGVHGLVTNEVLPAFDAILADLEGPGRRTAVDRVGLSGHPGGEDAYRTLVRQYATFSVTPEEVHRTGIERVAELTDRLAAVRAEIGFDGDEDAYAQVLRGDRRFHAASPAEVAATYERHVAAVEEVVDRWFAVRPKAPYGVERLDPALEPGMTFGYYDLPTPSLPVGRYRFNGSGLDTRSQINAAAIILHELVPGHHFHLARQAEDETLPRLRAEVAPLQLGAYTEGWAEYAADLGFEMGVYDDPWDRYGALVHQRFIAQRLVIDTGMNALGWSLERARDYMSRMTMESSPQVATETLRYSTDRPAQALGYGLGFLQFTRLREQARQRLGGAYDDREFHEVVLGPGSLPLEVVAANVDRWVATEGGERAPDEVLS